MPGIVIVTYNSADVVEECVKACRGIASASIVVVDNASQDGTVNIIPRDSNMRVIANPRNLGFAAAVNQGFEALWDFDAVLVLNPDATPVSGIDTLEAAAMEPGVGAATGRLLDCNGFDQHGFNVRGLPTAWTLAFEVLAINRLFPGNPVNRRYRKHVPESGGDIEQPAGAFLMVRRAAWAHVGGFDESFFPIWFEDVDFCKRLLDHGYRIRYVPEAAARHLGGHSASSLSWQDRQLFWYGSLLKYASKQLSATSRRVVALAVMLACFPRMVAGMLQFGISESVSVYSRVIWLAGRRLR
ncbi:MAG TPA: glycosyltransferase family 2 protein [Bryobacteraceae bacterium]|nr:glycosyltransferase family 2 protein [Bryobacteraceae bacterium]